MGLDARGEQQLCAAHEQVVARACRRLNRLLLPFALLFSVVASLDRANLAYAAVSMTKDLGFTPVDYGLGSAIFFISYSIFQVPSNVCFIYAGGPRLLGLIAVSWGIVAASMAAVTDRGAFLAVRFLLGIAEAGTVPGMWSYLASMYPAEHLTLPTTFYMAGITAAQALGAPLAAGLLSLDGAASLPGWRWLFILEGAPAVLLGFAIWAFLPAKVLHCKLLTPEEQAHLQAAIDGTIPPASSAPAAKAVDEPALQLPPAAVVRAVTHGGSVCSSGASSSSSSSQPGSPARSAALACSSSSSRQLEAQLGAKHACAEAAASSPSQPAVFAAGVRRCSQDGRPTARELLSDLAAAATCRVVWCASGWRFLFLLTLNGLVFWVPLLVHSMLEGPAAPNSSSSSSGHHSESKVLLLAAVPYVCGVATHVLNALHSNRMRERRYHIAVPWAFGGTVMLLLPVAWMRGAGSVSYALLVLASMGVMGCDGIDVSWIVALLGSLTSSQQVLALAMINCVANLGGFCSNYAIGALSEASSNYYGGVWLMGAVLLLAAAAVAAFPMAWAGAGAPLHANAGSRDAGDNAGGAHKEAQVEQRRALPPPPPQVERP